MNIVFFETINSTNTYVKENMETLTDRDVVHANSQTAGRGRFDRSWTDLGAENIYMTIVLKPSSELLPVYANLTQYLSLCLCKELEEIGLSPQIKWPNDVLLSGKKVCGILAETAIKGGELKGIALGIGVNLNAKQDDLLQIDRPATSLNLELGRKINKEEFMQKLLERFFANYDEFLKIGFKYIINDYINRAVYLNEEISVAIFEKVQKGTFVGFDDDGTLLLQDKNGETQSINMGEIV